MKNRLVVCVGLLSLFWGIASVAKPTVISGKRWLSFRSITAWTMNGARASNYDPQCQRRYEWLLHYPMEAQYKINTVTLQQAATLDQIDLHPEGVSNEYIFASDSTQLPFSAKRAAFYLNKSATQFGAFMVLKGNANQYQCVAQTGQFFLHHPGRV